MNNLVVIKSSVSDLNIFTSSLNSNSKFIIYNDNTLESEILDEIDSNITNVAFVWHFPGYYSMPFFDDGVDVNYMPIIQNQPYISNRFFQLIQDIKTKIGQSYKLDLLSCDLRENDFINAMNNYENTLGINIRFSIDRTGNVGGNWILESDGANIKDQYFTSNIDNWNHVLATGYTGSAVTSNISSDIVYNAGIYTLQNNITIDNDTYYIEISGNEVFDGQGYKITLTGNIAGLFAFINADSSANMGTVKNLSIEHSSSVVTYGGIFVRQQQKYFKIINCDSSGQINASLSGGICGANAGSSDGSTTNGYFEIERCYSTGAIGVNAGGITGYNTRSGLIKKCYSTGNISGHPGNAGGLCGNSPAYNGAVLNIIDCYTTGSIAANWSGGLLGVAAAGGNIGVCNIYNSYSSGSMTGNVGGIGGYNFGQYTICNIYRSFHNSNGNIFASAVTLGNIYYDGSQLASNDNSKTYVGVIDYPNLDPSYTPLSSWVFTTTSSGNLPVLTTTLNNANAGTILSNMNSYITPNSSYITNFKTFFQENSYNLDLSAQIYTTTLGDISGFTTTISSQPDISNGTVVKILSEEKYGTYIMDNSLVTSLKTGQIFYLPGFNGETITLKIGANSYVLTFGNSGFTYNSTSYGLDSEFALGTDIGFKVRFLGSGGLLGGEPTGGGGIGDPFIKPIFGASYYLPNDESTYLLFDNKDNLKLYTKTWFAPGTEKMSFMRYLIFEFNDNRACFDLETFKWYKVDDRSKYLSHSLDIELADILFNKLRITKKNKKSIRDYYGKRFSPSIENKVIEIEFFLEKQNIRLEIIRDLKYKDIRNNVNFIINGSIDREKLSKCNGSFISENNVRKVNNNIFFNKNIYIN